MKFLDVVIDATSFTDIRLINADTGALVGVVNANTNNSICYIKTDILTNIPGFENYCRISADNYTQHTLLGFWDYGTDKLVLLIPEDTGTTHQAEIFDYSILEIFKGFVFKWVKLKGKVELFVDPTYPIITLNVNDRKYVPMVPNVAAAIGISLEEN